METQTIGAIFSKNRKCIVNADLDGVLSGMLLQHFLDWRVVGYSSCCGKPNDELWLAKDVANITDCVFVDLPVCVEGLPVIDQHFVAFNEESVRKFLEQGNKINPNLIKRRVFSDVNGRSQYTAKYPFGTVHFILAALENQNIIDKNVTMDLAANLGGFDLADLLFRADRVIGNTNQYTHNCIWWIDWLLSIGGSITKELFTIARNEFAARLQRERNVENALLSFGCAGRDGDCSNLFRNRALDGLKKYFSFLGKSLCMEELPVFPFVDYGKLTGRKIAINTFNFNFAKEETEKDSVFSFAMVSMHALSITYKN